MSDIRVQLASFVARDVLVAELWVGKEQLAEVRIENLVPEIVIYPRKDGKDWMLSFAELEGALSHVRQRMKGDS